MGLLRPGEKPGEELGQPGVIARGQGGQGEFLISRGFTERAALTVDGIHRFFPDRTVEETRLAEPAAPDTAAENLAHGPVMDDVEERDDEGFGIVGGVEIPDDPLAHPGRGAVRRRDRGDGAVIVIGHVVQGGDVHPFDPRRRFEERPFREIRPLHRAVELQQLSIDLFPLSQGEQIDEIGERFRIAGAGSPRHHDRARVAPFLRPDRQAGEIQHIEHGGKAHFVLQREADEIEFPDRIPALDPEQGDLLPHEGFHIRVGRKHPLAPHILHGIEKAIQDFHPEMRHPHLI